MIYLRLFSQDPVTIFMAALVLGFALVLCFVRKPLGKTRCGKIFWRALCFVPLAACVIHFGCCRFVGSGWFTRHIYGAFYLTALVTAFFPLFDLWKIPAKVFSIILPVGAVVAFLYTIVYPMPFNSGLRNYTKQSYTQGFVSLTKDLEKYYSLKDWKKTDIQAIAKKIMPAVEEAERTNDGGLFYAAITAFGYYFYDGHVGTWPEGDWDAWKRGLILLGGNDYGFSMLRIDDGRVVAILSESTLPAYQAGIHNGTQIIEWNGKPIEQALAETECIYQGDKYPVKENEDFFRPVFLATRGMGESTDIAQYLISRAAADGTYDAPKARVTFLTDEGQPCTVELDCVEDGLNTIEYVMQFLISFGVYPNRYGVDKNFDAKMINDDTAYMLRYSEEYNYWGDIFSYLTGKYPTFKKRLRRQLEDLKSQGMKNLIIDARNNMGGYPALGSETASLFSDRTFATDSTYSDINGRHKLMLTDYVKADGEFKDINVLVLTNSYCVSAGDYFVRVMGECPNVTTMGFTCSNCSCQPQGGRVLLTNSICNFGYTINWLYEQDGQTRFIDTDETRTCTIPLDIKIPLTYDMAVSFDYDIDLTWEENQDNIRDYVMEYALEYLKQKK